MHKKKIHFIDKLVDRNLIANTAAKKHKGLKILTNQSSMPYFEPISFGTVTNSNGPRTNISNDKSQNSSIGYGAKDYEKLQTFIKAMQVNNA